MRNLNSERLGYLIRSAIGQFRPSRKACPCCGTGHRTMVRRKMLITALVRCENCQLLYRVPADPRGHTRNFYKKAYRYGPTTDCPGAKELANLIKSRFKGFDRDYGTRIQTLAALGVAPKARILDFGASWGYGVWQLRDAGYDAIGYEVGVSRAEFARTKLNVPVEHELEQISGSFDVFFSSHVLEHLPCPAESFQIARDLVRRGGLFVAYTPNGSAEMLAADPARYDSLWGYIHPTFPDAAFYERAFPDNAKLLCSTPFSLSEIEKWDRRENVVMSLSGWELLAVVAL